MAVVDASAQAMGTAARLFVHGGPSDVEMTLRDRLADLERRWSRFIESSEVSELNRRAGEACPVSPDTLDLLVKAVEASQRTRGWFDPLLLRDLVDAGYDRTWDEIADRAVPLIATVHPTEPGRVEVFDWPATTAALRIDRSAATATVPSGTAFDPGGIGKGLAADILADAAIGAGAQAVLVSLGGDIRAGGTPPPDGWLVALEDPFDRTGAPAFHVRIPWGAVATSTIARRRWETAVGTRHHLLDPRTGAPADSGVVAVTAIAGTCWLAETMAKAALVAGIDAGLALLDANGVEAVMTDAAGDHHFTPHMPAYLS